MIYTSLRINRLNLYKTLAKIVICDKLSDLHHLENLLILKLVFINQFVANNDFCERFIQTSLKPTAQKKKFSVKDFFNKCDKIGSFLQIWPHLLKKSLMKNLIFCVVIAEGSNFRQSNNILNPFLAHRTRVPILYHLKIPENQRFSGIFTGYTVKHWSGMG